jgi:dynein heavy chain
MTAVFRLQLSGKRQKISLKIQRTIRAPVPWEAEYTETHNWVHTNLHIVNKINSVLKDIWCDNFINTRFVSLKDLNAAPLPMYPEDFEKFFQKKCLEQRELLEKSWIPKCAKAILELKDYWRHLVPMEEDASLELPMRFFATIATLMSNQLRDLVVDSLGEFVDFLEQYKVRKIIKLLNIFFIIKGAA